LREEARLTRRPRLPGGIFPLGEGAAAAVPSPVGLRPPYEATAAASLILIDVESQLECRAAAGRLGRQNTLTNPLWTGSAAKRKVARVQGPARVLLQQAVHAETWLCPFSGAPKGSSDLFLYVE
jgi:hypothetical protein